MLLIQHHNENNTPVAVVPDDTTQERINEIIVESFADWCVPPENYKLVREDFNAIYIKYDEGYIDYDGDGYFTVQDVPVK